MTNTEYINSFKKGDRVTIHASNRSLNDDGKLIVTENNPEGVVVEDFDGKHLWVKAGESTFMIPNADMVTRIVTRPGRPKGKNFPHRITIHITEEHKDFLDNYEKGRLIRNLLDEYMFECECGSGLSASNNGVCNECK